MYFFENEMKQGIFFAYLHLFKLLFSVGATSGEGQALSVPERKSLAEEWMKAIKSTKLHLMVHIGGAPLPDVLELVSHKILNLLVLFPHYKLL